MRRVVVLFIVAGVMGGGAVWAVASKAAQPASAARAAVPVVVELFTSEGCSSCPPADRLLSDLAAADATGASLVVLSEHVDYWNRLGWTDPFSSKDFTKRQQDYAERLGADVYTPQMVVDGRWQFIGSDRSAATAAIRQASIVPKLLVSLTARVVEQRVEAHVSVATPDTPGARRSLLPEADVMLALTEDGLLSSVTAGENAGRRLSHAGVTRALAVGGTIREDSASMTFNASLALDPRWTVGRMRVVAFVQSKKDLAIVGAASAHLGAQGDASLEGR